ncbi:hypothetical protein LguiB_033617 [Lonicera macranthoides]
MDFDEWEIIPHDRFLETYDDGGKIFWGKYGKEETNTDFNMNPFTNPSPKDPPKFVDSTTEEESRSHPNQLVPTPIQFHQTEEKNPDDELAKKIESPKVFFNIENENFDLKMDSEETESKNRSSRSLEEDEKEDSWGENKGNLKVWKWTLNGIGAVCSFGVAAVTVGIVIFGNGQTRKQNHHKLRFQLYADDKRIKKVVEHANQLNEAISAARGFGVPFTKAQITFGGHYDSI